VGQDPIMTRKSIFVIPPNQPKPPLSITGSVNDNSNNILFCRLILDSNKLCQKKEEKHNRQAQPNSFVNNSESKTNPKIKTENMLVSNINISSKSKARKRTTGKSKSNGFLGNLLVAHRKTEQHLASVPKSSIMKTTTTSMDNTHDGTTTVTTGSIIAKFRHDMEQKLLDFQQNTTCNEIKIPISINEITKDLTNNEQKLTMTMDIFKYIVYEQAEEIGQDKWVAAKEPGEFTDETIVAVYKEGHAPASVLEDLMNGDLPDEIRGQQRAIREAQMKVKAKKEGKDDLLRQQKAIRNSVSSNKMTQLNTQKRDRRTIAEIQRDMMTNRTDEEDSLSQNESKRPRTTH